MFLQSPIASQNHIVLSDQSTETDCELPEPEKTRSLNLIRVGDAELIPNDMTTSYRGNIQNLDFDDRRVSKTDFHEFDSGLLY